MRVALVLSHSSGGIGQHCRTLAQALVARGDAVMVVAPAPTLERFGFATAGVQVVPLDAGALTSLLRPGELRAQLAGCDVVHGHGVRVGAMLARAGVRPLVVTWHNAPLGGGVRRAVHRALELLSARGATVVLGASDDLVERARRAGARDARFCPVSAPALPAPAPPGSERRPSERPVVLAIARLARQKRLDLLVDATAGWADRPDRPRVVVAGAGPLRDLLQRRARRVRSPLELLGDRSDVAALLAEASVVALPSDWEARPLAAQEALRAGVPLVATAVGGVPSLVGDAAVLVPPGDAGALREALQRVLADEEMRRRLAAAGRKRAAEWPSEAEMTTLIRQTYLDVRSTVR